MSNPPTDHLIEDRGARAHGHPREAGLNSLRTFRSPLHIMGKKGAKATRKFAKSGELKRTIDARRKHQKIKKQIQTRKTQRGKPIPRHDNNEDSEGDNEHTEKKKKGKPKSNVIDFLDGDEAGEAVPEDGKKRANKYVVPLRGVISPPLIMLLLRFSGMSVDDLFGGEFMDNEDEVQPMCNFNIHIFGSNI